MDYLKVTKLLKSFAIHVSLLLLFFIIVAVGARYFVLDVIYFFANSICIDVAMCFSVHIVKTVHGLGYLLTASGNLG